MHSERTSTVIVHTVRPEGAEQFLEWQREVNRVVATFAGYQSTEIYPPSEPGNLTRQWVVVIHFDKPESLRLWLESPERSQWLSQLPDVVLDFRLRTLPAGFAGWFAGLVEPSEEKLPPAWKMVLTVLLGLYPTVMLLSLYVGPIAAPLGMAVAMLLSNAISVCILQWLIMPTLTRLLAPWLRAKGPSEFKITVIGVLGIFLTLAGMALLFRWIKG